MILSKEMSNFVAQKQNYFAFSFKFLSVLYGKWDLPGEAVNSSFILWIHVGWSDYIQNLYQVIAEILSEYVYPCLFAWSGRRMPFALNWIIWKMPVYWKSGTKEIERYQKAGKIIKRQICYTIILPKQEAEYFIPGENKLLVWTK